MPVAVSSTLLPFRVELGRSRTSLLQSKSRCGLGLAMPVLAGRKREEFFAPAKPAHDLEGLSLFTSGDLLLGCATERVTDERALSQQSQALYRRLLTAARGRHLYRIWNFVPRINELTDGFENYRAFCQGRSLAFEAEIGAGFPQVLPSASGVGSHDGALSIVFVAGHAKPRHFENPEQVPAYRYPIEHGPRSPSFSRATVVRLDHQIYTFISGTAAIKGHRTVAPDDLAKQLDCTLDNLRLIADSCGLGLELGAKREGVRHFKIYLRHPSDLAATRRRLERDVLRADDQVTYVQADICRAALNVEIEVSVISKA